MFFWVSERDGIQWIGADKCRPGDNIWRKVCLEFVGRVERGDFWE